MCSGWLDHSSFSADSFPICRNQYNWLNRILWTKWQQNCFCVPAIWDSNSKHRKNRIDIKINNNQLSLFRKWKPKLHSFSVKTHRTPCKTRLKQTIFSGKLMALWLISHTCSKNGYCSLTAVESFYFQSLLIAGIPALLLRERVTLGWFIHIGKMRKTAFSISVHLSNGPEQ